MSSSNDSGASLTSELAELILIANAGNSSLVVNTGSKPALFIDTDTKVGINTLTPSAQLDIASDDGTCLCLRYGESETAFANVNMTIDGDLEINPMATGSKLKTSGSLDLVNHNGSSIGLKLGGQLVEATANQLNYTSVTAGTAAPEKALVLNAAKSISGITSLSATTLLGVLHTSAQPYITSIGSLSSLTVETDITADGYIGRLKTAAQPNITSVGTLSSLAVVGGITASTVAATLTTAAQPNITSVGALSSISIAGSTISAEAAYLSGVVAGSAASSKALVLNSSGAISGIQSLSSVSITGTLTAGLQPNITGVGTLSSLTVTNAVSASTLAGTLTTAAQPNITSIGALSSISIAGSTISAEAAYLAGANVGTASASKVVVLSADKGFSGIGALSASTLAGTLTTAAQPNITSVGSLTSISIAGSTISAEAAYLSGTVAGTGTASKALVLNNAGSISGITSLSATSLTGTLQTSTQPNVTSLGTLSSLNVGGSVTFASTSDAVNATAGAVVVSGGLAVAKSAYIGTSLHVIGSIYTNGQLVSNADPNGYLDVTPGTAANSKALILGNDGNISGIGVLSASSITVGGVAISSTDLGYLDDIVPGTAAASKALVLNAATSISGIATISATNIEGTLQTGAQPNITSVGTLSVAPQVAFSNSGASLVSYQLWRNTSGTPITVGIGMSSSAAMFGTTTNNKLHLMANGTSSIIFQTSGNVSIGHDSDAYKLSVNGTLNATSYYSGGSVLDFSGLPVVSGITGGTAAANKALVLDGDRSVTNVNSLTVASLTIGSNALSTIEASYLTDITAGTATASKALVLDASKNISGIEALSATTINGSIATASQTSITAVGTLSSLATSGSITTTINNNTATNSSYQTWTNSLTTAMTVGLSMNNASPAFGTSSNHKLRFRTNATDAMFIQSSGNVSIGSDVDTYKLNVAGSLNATSYNLNGVSVNLLLISGITAGTASASKALIVDGNKDINGIRNLSTSAVSTSGLSISSSSPNGVAITNVTAASTANVQYVSNTYSGAVGVRGSTATNPNTMYFEYNGQPRMLINPSGEVAVGTSSFGYGLNVGGSINATALYVNGSPFSGGSSEYVDGSTAGTATASKAMILDANKAISGMGNLTFTSTGRPYVEGFDLNGASFVANWAATNRWGIGQHTNTSALAIRIGGCNSDGTWNTSYPTVYTGQYNTMSDHRLKENFRDLPYGLDAVNKLRPLMYDLKSNPTPEQIGFIAHEVQEIIPSVVNGTKDEVDEEGNEVHQSVSYTSLVPVMVKAIQELSDKNNSLEAQIAMLIERVNALEK